MRMRTIIRYRTTRNVNLYETVKRTLMEAAKPMSAPEITEAINNQLSRSDFRSSQVHSQLKKLMGYGEIMRIGRGLYVAKPLHLTINIDRDLQWLTTRAWWDGGGTIEDVERDLISLIAEKTHLSPNQPVIIYGEIQKFGPLNILPLARYRLQNGADITVVYSLKGGNYVR